MFVLSGSAVDAENDLINHKPVSYVCLELNTAI